MENGWIMGEQIENDKFQKGRFLVHRKGDKRDYVIYIYSDMELKKIHYNIIFFHLRSIYQSWMNGNVNFLRKQFR